jgi:Ca2+-binding RTX toxin-like protein
MRGPKAVAASIVALALLAPAAPAKPGDLIVGVNDKVIRVKPSGKVSTISSDADFDGTAGTTFDAAGDLFAADYSAFSGDGAVFRIELPGGATSALVQEETQMPQPVFLDFHPNGFLYVADFQSEHLLQIDPGGNEAVPIADGVDIFGIVALPDGRLMTSTLDGEFLLFGPDGGAPDPLTVSGQIPGDVYGLGVDARGRILFGEQGEGDVFRLTIGTGWITRLATGGGLLGDGAYQAVEMANGKIAVAAGEKGIVVVNPKTGGKSRLTRPGKIEFAEGISIEPPKCAGRLANIVGTNKRDKLKGSKFPDVIAGLGGDDEIKGLGGDDRLCGNGGDDLLVGGPGDDRLNGGPGHDRERQ